MSEHDDFPDTYEPLFPNRHKRFLEAFPAKEYSVRISHDLLDKEQLELLIKADPKQAADQIREAYNAPTFLFRAELVHIETGNVVQRAHAARRVMDYKDYEVGETAARQRVVAAAGFDGHVMQEDEKIDAADQGLMQRPVDSTPDQDDVTATQEVTSNAEDESQEQEEVHEPEPEPAKDDRSGEQTAPPAMVNQIRQQASRKGLPMDVPNDISWSRARTLLKQVTSARVAVS